MAEQLQRLDVVESYSYEELADNFMERPEGIRPERLAVTPPEVIGTFMEQLDVEQCRALLRTISGDLAGDALAEMDPEFSSRILYAMRASRAAHIMSVIAPDDAADIVAELGDEEQKEFIGRLEPDDRQDVERLMAYDPESAGGIMTPDVVTIPPHLTMDEAITSVRAINTEVETFYYLYVTGPGHVLLGVVSLRDLLLAPSDNKVQDVMKTKLHGVCNPDDDREVVAMEMTKHNFVALPVVERGTHRLLGIITHDDIMDVVHEEATEDFQKLVGAGADESMRDGIGESVKRRWPWLVVNLLTAFGAAAIIRQYEKTLEEIILLAAFMPIVASLAGNGGHQTLAIAIRSLATGDVHKGDALPLCLRELAKGLSCGLLIGAIGAFGAYALSDWNIRMALTIFLALVMTMAMAGFTGAFIPLFLKRLNLDPAQSSSIFLTAITDMAGFFVFLQLASILLM